jgi:competence protein ComEC
VVIALLRTPLRWSGAGLIVVAVALAATPPRPDVLVAASGEAVAVRTGDGRLSMVKTGNDAFAFREWLAADGDARPAADPALGQGFSCDPVGCIARLGDGSVVALARAAEAFADDCARAALIVTAREAPPGCGAKVIGRGDWQAGGALALRRTAKGWEIAATRPPGLDRPWAPTRRTEPPASIPAIGRPAARDATPHPEDLEAGD